MKFRVLVGAATAFAALSLTACGGSSGGGANGSKSDAAQGAAEDAGQGAAPTAAPKEPVPAAFDNTKGWETKDDEHELSGPVISEEAGLVLLRWHERGGKTARVVAKDAKTGQVRWSTKPLVRPEEPKSGRPVDSQVLLARGGTKEYAVLAVTGVEGGDGVNIASPVTRLAVYDIASSGDAAEPLRQISVPGTATGLTAQRELGVVTVVSDQGVSLVDVASGRVITYDGDHPALKSPKPCRQLTGTCDSRRVTVAGQTPAGPLVQGYGAFWAGGWFSGDVVPADAVPEHGGRTVEASSLPNGDALASWPDKEGSAETNVYAVHDGKTGKVRASVACANERDSAVTPTVSGDGRYVLAGRVVIDLQAGKGHCFEQTSTRKAITVSTVDKDGTAHGETAESPAAIDLSSGKASPLPEGTLLPDVIGADVAVFGTTTAGGESILVYPRR
ncbi:MULTISPECIES: hypothetical protein [Streptomyces]|uniref:hypothetical protein n=1 Tax=Streptomyces TaxID=1883 RepID=UPI00123AEC45|nr:hypothetical protein [Streptomyces venezuelae]